MTRPDNMLDAQDQLKREYKSEMLEKLSEEPISVDILIEIMKDDCHITEIWLGEDEETGEDDAVMIKVEYPTGENTTNNLIEDFPLSDIHAVYETLYYMN